MSYKTRMMEQILQSPEAMRISRMISPVYGEAYTFLWLIQIIGMALDDAQEWTASIAVQVTPMTATWSIGYWEQEYGTKPEPWWTLEQRRQNVMNFMHYVQPMPPQRLSEITSNDAGVPVDVIERTGKNKFAVVSRFNTNGFERVRSVVDKYKPAHLIFDLYVSRQVYPGTAMLYAGAAAAVRRQYTSEVK